MPIFDLNGKKYDVEDKYLDAFSKQNPDAYAIEEREGKRYKVRAKDYGNFRTHFDKPQQKAVHQSEDDAEFEANAERFRSGQPIERVTTQSVIDANPELGLQTNAVQPEVDQTQQYIMNNKPTIFGGKKKSLMDVPLNVSPDAIEGGENLEKLSERARIAEHNMKDSFVQKARTEADVRGLASEIDGLLEKSVQEERASVGGSAFMPAGARGRAYTEANKERVKEVTDLSSAKRLLDQSQYIIDAAKRGDTGILKDTWQGFKDSLEAEDFTFGLADAASSASILDAIKKVENGEELTEAEDKLLRASAINMATQYYYANDLNRAYKAGQVSAESVPFMLEMAINPISSLGKASAKTLLNYGLKSYAKQVGKGLAKGAAAGTGMALTTGLGRVAAGTTDRLAEGYNYGVDFDGNLYAKKKEDAMGVGEAVARSLASTAIENQSEMIFNAFKGFGGFMKGVQDVLPGGVNKFFDLLRNNKAADAYRWLKNSKVFRNYLTKDLRNATQIGGLGEEYLEEVYNNLANFAIGEMEWKDVVSLDNNIDTMLGLVPTQVMFGLLGMGGAGAMRYQTRKTIEDLQATMNEQQRRDLEGLLDLGLDAKEVDVRGFIRGVMQNENYTIENKRDLIKAAYYVAKQKGIDELTEADTIDKVSAENAIIDSMTDPSTGVYSELVAKLPDGQGGQEEVSGCVVGWIGEGDKRQPVFVPEGMENTYENRRVLRPTEWVKESLQEMPAERVKAVSEEMIREEAAQQAEMEAKYAPEVINAQMQQGVPFNTPTSQIIPISPLPEGNGWVVEEYALDTNNKVAKTPIVRELTNDEYRDMLQAQIDAQEAVNAPVNNMTSGENVGEQVNAGVNALVNNVQPVAEGVATEQQTAQPQAPVIPTKEDGSIDFVAYGKDNTYKTLGERYGEKMPNKVAVTAKALASDLKKAKQKLVKAEEALDNAPIGREQKAEEARNKAMAELEAIQKEADFWAEMDADIKNAQAQREAILNPQADVDSSTEPMTTDEFIAQQLAAGNIVLSKTDYMAQTGYGAEEVKAMNGGAQKLITDSGMTLDAAGERLMEMDRENGTNFFNQDDATAGRDALIELLGSVRTRKELNQYIAENRKAQAKKESEAIRNASEEYVMSGGYESLEDYLDQMEAAEMENPFLEDRADEIMAIFAEEAAKYEQSINNTENGQGTENENAERSDSVLPEEQSDDSGRTEEQPESERVGDGIGEEGEGTHEESEDVKAPLRKRAKEWEQKLGVKVNLIESLDEVANREVIRAIKNGQRVTGWFEESTGEVCFYMPYLESENEVDSTYIHEVVAHKGLRGLLGDKFDAFCDEVWESMSAMDKAKFITYPGVDGIKAETEEETIIKKRRAAADEYIAHLAENIDVTDSAWGRFTELVKRFLKAIGLEPKITNADIANLIKLSYANLSNNAVERIEENVGEVDAEKGDVRFAVRDVLKGEEREQAIKDLMAVTGRNRRTVVKWLKAEESLASVILNEDNVGILDMEADESVPSIWKNSDYPQGTVEFSNICKKRLPFTTIYQRLQKEFPNTLFDAQTLNTIRNTMKEMGEDVACALCFVEDRRQLLGEIGQGFIDAVKGMDVEVNDNQKTALDKLRESGDKYVPNLFDIITLDGMKELRKKHPAVAQAFIEYNNARGMQSGRLFQAYSAYNREILKYNKKKVESINNNGGLRIFSFSDFEAHHLIDLVQVLTDCAAKGIKVQGYTKVPEFAKAVKDTNAKINRSLIPKGVGYVDADYVPKEGEAVSPNVINGKRLLFDTIEGIDVNNPNFFDSTGSKSVGNILVAINDEHARLAMADPFVDYIIGFHTGQSKAILKGKGIDTWVNYKNEQLDKEIVTDKKGNQKMKNAPHHGLNIYTDVLNVAEAEGNPIRTAKQFTERFIEECNKRGWIPRFHRFLNRAKDGRFLYTPGYHKFLIDFKLFDKNGKILPQEAVVPKFDNAFNKQILDDYVKGVKEEMPNDAVYEAVKEALGLTEEVKPIGVGAFGNIYDQFKGKAQEAIRFLSSIKGGEAVGALYHPEIGDIDLVWGKEGTAKSDGFGLAKLIKFHPEVVDNLQEIISEMKVTRRSENRVQLESDTHQAAVILTWDNAKKNWLLTAFEKRNSASDNTTDTGETNKGKRNDTATPQNTVPTDKDSYSNLETQERSASFRIINHNQEIFVSNAQKAVEGIKQEKGTPQQWLAMIEKNGGLKAGEDKWLGLSDWLKGLDKKSVTKAEILEFIGENKIQIEEVKYGEDGYFINDTRLDYTTKGLENKAEIALVVPTIESWNQDDEIHFGDAGEGRAVAWIRFGETTAPQADFEKAAREADDALTAYQNELAEKYLGDEGSGDPTEYLDMMSEEEGKHMRELSAKMFDTREAVNDNQVRVLVIDEIQSKRHQEGREKGYKDDFKAQLDSAEREWLKADKAVMDKAKEIAESLGMKRMDVYKDITSSAVYRGRQKEFNDKRLEEIYGQQLIEEFQSLSENKSQIAKTIDRIKVKLYDSIPSAPFEKNWSELAFKRMLRYAAENGFDKVAWTTGAQQMERYNLDKFIDSIDISKSKKSEGKYHVVAWDKDYNDVVTASGHKTPDEMKELFGEEITQKLIDGVNNLKDGEETYVLEGTAIPIGNEGMKGFYDKMLPSFVNKYVKKWGTKVQDIELPNVEKAGRIMHSVDVTEAMKESVMGGQTMFRISDYGKKVKAEVDKVSSKYNSKDVMFFDNEMTDEEVSSVIPGYTAADIKPYFDEGILGGYSSGMGKISIFANNNPVSDIEDTLFHENLHSLLKSRRSIVEAFAENALERFPKNVKKLQDSNYEEKDIPEELLVRLTAKAMVYGIFDDVAYNLPEGEFENLKELLKEFGYEYEQEIKSRALAEGRRGTPTLLEGEEIHETRRNGQDASGRQGEVGKGRKRKERLGKLLDQVADMGLEGVLGNKAYSSMMVDIYKAMPEDVRAEIADDAIRHYGGSVAPAVNDFIGPKSDGSFMDKVVAIVRDALRKIGIGLDLNANEVRYMAWRSKKPLDRKNLMEVAEDIDMRYRLKVGEYEGSPTPDGGGTRFRVSGKLNVRDEYEATIRKGGYQAREAVQDAMLSLRRFQELIEKATGEKIRDFENAWMHENRLSSVVQAKIHEMERKFYKPMVDAVKKVMKVANLEQEQVADYLMLKHGIERNREMAVRKALTDSGGKIDRTRLEQWYQEKEAIRNDDTLDTWRKKQEAMDNAALNYGADMSRDYSGLTSMFDTDDIEECTNKAYDEVEALETDHPVETEALGKAIKAMTQNTLDESFGSGLMDRKVYNELSKDMYDYYIPLRGFEETTSDEVYAYLDQDRGAFNAPLQRAKGRSSKSDNPIAYLKSIAESGLMQGERNKMKQSFLNLVINHPSDLVSVREGVWAIFNPATGEWEAAAPPTIPNNATPAEIENIMEAWDQQMEQAAQNDPTLVKKIAEAADVPYRVVGNKMNQHQIIVKRLGKSYTLTINGNPRLAMALNGLTNPNNRSNDGKVAAYVSGKIDALNRSLAAWYTTRNPDFVASNFMRDTFYTNTIVRAKEGNKYANKFHKNYAMAMPQMLSLFSKYEKGTLNPANPTEAAFLDFMMNGGETGYSNLKDLEHIKKQIAKELKGNRFAKVEALAEKLDILNRAVENTARFAAFLTSREEGRSIAKSVFDAKEISVNFNKKGAGGTFFGMTGQTKFGNLAAMVGAGGRALYVFFNAAIQGSTNLMHVMKVNPKGTSAGLAAMFLMGAVVPFLFGDDDEEKDYYDLPEHVRRNHLIIPGAGDAWISIPLPIEYRIMYGMGELLTSWRTGHERGKDIARKMLSMSGQALPLNFLEEGFEAFVPSSISPLWQVYNNRSWTGLPIYKDNEFNKDDPEYTKAYKNVDRGLYNFTKALYHWTFDEENQEEGIDLNPAVIESLARGYFGGLATQLGNIVKTAETIAGEREFDWRSIPIGNRLFKSGDERTKEKRVTNEYFENMEKLDFLQSRERTLKKTINGEAVPQADKEQAKIDDEIMRGSEVFKKYQEFKKLKKVVDKIRKTMKEKGSTPEREKQLIEAQEAANKAVR